MEDDNESMDEQRQQRLRNLDVTSLSPEDRLWLDAEEKRLMNKYEQIILKAEQDELLKESTTSTEQKEPEPERPPAWIVRTRRVQAYWDGNNRKVPVRRKQLQDDFVRDFAAHQGRELEPDSYAVDVLLVINISNDNYWTVRLQATMEATVDLLIQCLDEWLDYQVDSHNYRLTDQRGEIVEVQLDATLPVGASLVQLQHHGKPKGLFIEIKKAESALAQVAGDRMVYCAIVKSVNGRTCPIISIFKGVKHFAMDRNEPLKLELKCLLPEDASLLWSKQARQQGEKEQAVTKEENSNDKNHKGQGGDLPPPNNNTKNHMIDLCDSKNSQTECSSSGGANSSSSHDSLNHHPNLDDNLGNNRSTSTAAAPGQKRTTRSKSAAVAEEKENEVIDLYSSDDEGLEDTPPVSCRLCFSSRLPIIA